VGVRVPVTLGGEKKTEIPGEEISVRLRDGKMVMIVQELSSPPFAPGERVRVQYEKPDELNGVSRTKVVRDY
jgi:outer membrane lipoprotein SlyB